MLLTCVALLCYNSVMSDHEPLENGVWLPPFMSEPMSDAGPLQRQPALQLVIDAADRIRDQISLDAKTGLLKQEAWFDDLDTAIENLQPGERLVVYMADLDNFKTINDTLGHDAGDEVLGIVAEAFKQTFKRETDEIAHGSRERRNSEGIARLGGDEFAVFSTTKANGFSGNQRHNDNVEKEVSTRDERVNTRLQELIAGTRFDGYKLRLSIGEATCNEDDTAKTLLVRADTDMIHAKYQGKIDSISEDDRKRLREIINFLQKVGARVEPWLVDAANVT